MSRSDRAPAGVPEPGGDRFQPRRLALIGALTAASFALVAALIGLIGSQGKGDDGFDQEFLAVCERSDVSSERCRCALDRWNATLDTTARLALDTALTDNGTLPPDLGSALQAC
ncbi:MAG: hypothetical protein ACKV2O_10830 [Acidimicrobiales bacterium]